jgi:hypothetical protein
MNVSFSVGLILCLVGPATPEQGQSPAMRRLQPPDLIAQVLTDRPEAPLAGELWTLSRALSASRSRTEQRAITLAYWQLAEAAAKYNAARIQIKKLQDMQPRPGEEAMLRAAQSSAAARRSAAELSATEAQYALAAPMHLPPQSALPWPGDLPHVGGYRTNYQELTLHQMLPDRARLIDRILPLQRSVIEGRAAAVLAAEDVLAALEEDHRTDRADLSAVITAVERRFQQQAAFIETVCGYNREIAEYACAAAPPGLPPAQLATWLIPPAPHLPAPSAVLQDSAVQPADHLEPTPAPPENLTGKNQPTPAVRLLGPLVPVAPTPAENDGPPAESSSPAVTTGELGIDAKGTVPFSSTVPAQPSENRDSSQLPRSPTSPPSDDPFTPRKNKPTPARRPRPEEKGTVPPTLREKEDNPQETISTASPRLVRKEVLTTTAPQASATAALYSALQGADPAVQAKQLTLILHENRVLPEHSGRPMALEECLSRWAGGDRKAAVSAYWTVGQRAAEYQVSAEQRDILDSLTPKVLERRGTPSGAGEMLQLRAAQLDAKAAVLEARVRLAEAQFVLARLTQATAAAEWPLPTTAPHFGQYDMKFEEQSRRITESWPMRRLAATIPQFSGCLQEQAAAVIAADAARTDAATEYDAGRAALTTVLNRIASQTRRTLEFLQTQNDYNRALAEYVLSILPPETPPNRLVAALVVKP